MPVKAEKKITKRLKKEHPWQPLFNLINEIARTKSFGEMVIDHSNKKVKHLPYMDSSGVVSSFIACFYSLNLAVDFNWTAWREGMMILNEKKHNFSRHRILTLRKLLTAIVRADRFMEGYLVSQFSNGNILKIIRALEKKSKNT